MANQFVSFTPEQDKWICENYWNMSIKELTCKFNELFEPKRSYAVIKQRTRRTLKLSHKFTDDHKQFLKDNYYNNSVKELTTLFNQTFNQNRSTGVIKVECLRLGLHVSDNQDRMAKSRKALGMPIGSIVVRNGYKYIKTSMEYDVNDNWQFLHRVLWQTKFGSIPENGTIIFLDNNTLNTDISNLYCVSGKVHRELIKNKWRFDDPDITLLAIKICELHFLITQGEEPLQKER